MKPIPFDEKQFKARWRAICNQADIDANEGVVTFFQLINLRAARAKAAAGQGATLAVHNHAKTHKPDDYFIDDSGKNFYPNWDNGQGGVDLERVSRHARRSWWWRIGRRGRRGLPDFQFVWGSGAAAGGISRPTEQAAFKNIINDCIIIHDVLVETLDQTVVRYWRVLRIETPAPMAKKGRPHKAK